MNKLTAEKCSELLGEIKYNRENCFLSENTKLLMDIAESAILRQQGRGEGGWIEWKGGECPVDAEDIVQVKFKDETESLPSKAGTKYWSRVGLDTDIIAYRIIPERTTNQNGEVS